ncbi:accessory gene regulator B family protein [Carnobacterium maltaromaticum]|uniref:accessory gene regulator B family protein n=1 Tax=Carnobacterium maltaromaticum TaxID=2751 RepID=UPI0039BE118D
MEDKSMEEKLSRKFCEKYLKSSNLNKVEKVKVEYGLSVILINLVKLIIVYGFAFLLGGTIDTLIVHISFLFVRRYSYGYHASKSFNCTLITIFLFAIFPYYINEIAYNYNVSLMYIILNTSLVSTIIFVMSPQVTKNNIVKDYRAMKIKSIIATSIIALLILFISDKTKKLLLLYSLSIVAFTLVASKVKKGGK